MDGISPSFAADRAPTPHPLQILVAVPLSLLGDAAPRVWVSITVLSYAALLAGTYALHANPLGQPVGITSSLLVASRPDYISYGLRGVVDAPFLALVAWAAAVAAREPRRCWRVLFLPYWQGCCGPRPGC